MQIRAHRGNIAIGNLNDWNAKNEPVGGEAQKRSIEQDHKEKNLF
jgi:hypothetical protein